MTAKKDLKKKKSKKKGKKTNIKSARGARGKKIEERMIPIADAVARDKNIAIVSLIQTFILMIVSIIMIVAKPGSKMGKKVLEQNMYLLENILTPTVMIGLEVVMFAIMLVYVYKSIKSRQLKKFYYTGIVIAALAIAFCLTQDIEKFPVFGYGIIAGLVIVILQIVKLFYVNKIEKIYAKESEKNDMEKEKSLDDETGKA